MTGQFVYSLIFKADATQAKATTAQVVTAVDQVTTKTVEATGATGEHARALVVEAAAARQAAAAATGLGSAVSQSSTAMNGAMNATTGLTRVMGSQIEAMRAEQRELALMQSGLDALRARYNPLFAVSRQYEQELRDIADAEKMGAISAREAAAARDRAGQSMAPLANGLRNVGDGSRAASAHVAQLGYQFNDIGLMMASGQSPFMLMMQQGPQVTQVFDDMRRSGTSIGGSIKTALLGMLNPMNLATMGLIAFGAIGVQWLMSLGGEVKTVQESLEDLTKSVGEFQKEASRDAPAVLREFGAINDEIVKMQGNLAKLAEIKALRDLGGTLAALRSEAGSTSNVADLLGVPQTNPNAKNRGDVVNPVIRNFGASLNDLNKADGPRAQLTVVQDIQRQLLSAAGSIDNMTEAQSTYYSSLLDTEGAIRRIIAARVQEARQSVELARAAGTENSRMGGPTLVDLGPVDQEALARTAAKRRAVQRETMDDLRRQGELSTTILQFGEKSAEAEGVRERHAREVLKARLQEVNVAPPLVTQAVELLEAEQARLRAIKAQAVAKSAANSLTDLRGEAEINAAILQYGKDALLVKKLQIEAQRRAYEQSLDALNVIGDTKRELLAAWDAARGMASADPFGTLGAGRDYLKSQQERIAQLRLEQSLIGQSEATRTRMLALYQAEQDMARDGIAATSAHGVEILKAAEAEAELTRIVERQKGAWQTVQSSAESAIDNIIEKLTGGDVGGALEALAGEVAGMFSELAITNPLKNAMLGTNYGTLQDVGGLGGIWARLTGKGDAASITASSMGQQVGSMQVNAGTVMIGGAGIAGLLNGAANLPGVPMAGQPASPQTQAFLRSAAIGGGTRPDAISGLNGGFADPLAAMMQAAAQKFGPNAIQVSSGFRSNERQAQLWQEALQKYGSEAEARKWVAPPGSSRHNHGLAADLKFNAPGAQDWAHQNAGQYGLGFRMKNEPWHIEPVNAGAMMADKALMKFGTTATDATTNLGTLGTGFDVFGNALAQGLSGAANGGGSGGFLSALIGGLAGAIGIPGFAAGGWTGGSSASEVRGVVHGREFVFDAAATDRIGPENLEALRKGAIKGFKSGGYVGPSITSRAAVIPANNPAPVIQLQPILVNNTSRQMAMEVEETTDARGQKQQRYIMSDLVAEGIATPGGKGARTMKSTYGMKRVGRQRS